MDSDEEFSVFLNRNDPPAHWRLKKLFIRRYIGKISEDELECLAQALVNVEFLGCRYPKETMLRLQAMSADILKEFGSNKLRVLVSADSAIQDRNASKYRRVKSSTSDAKSGIAIEPQVKSLPPVRDPIAQNASQLHRKFYNILSSVVGFKVGLEAQNYCNSLQKIFQSHKEGNFEERIEGERYECRYNNNVLVKYCGRKARSAGSEKVYTLLKNYCPFLVRVASHCAEDNLIVKKQESSKPGTSTGPETFDENKIGTNNIGYRMLKALGWEPDKKVDHGIIDPIGLSVKIGRRGLGAETESTSSLDMNYFKKLMSTFKDSGTDFDLVFSSEFSKEERAALHVMAQKLQLKTKSEGKGDDRFLVVRRKDSLSPWELLNKVRSEDPFYSAIWRIEKPELKEYNDLNL